MEIRDNSIFIEVEYDTEDIFRPILLEMQTMQWYELILRNPLGVLINFLLSLTVLYFSGRISALSILLAVIVSIVLSGFVFPLIFKRLGAIGTFLEYKFLERYKYPPRLKTKFVLNSRGVTKVVNRDTEISVWADIKEASETEKDIVLSLFSQDAYYFPKRIFQDFDEMAYFKKFIRQRVGESAVF